MNASKIISFAAFIFWTLLLGFVVLWDVVSFPPISYQSGQPQVAYQEALQEAFINGGGELGLYAVINLGYYFFLRKRSRENRVPKYATSIALLLALIPLVLSGAFLPW